MRSHRNLRFVATACVLYLAQGVMEVEKETQEALTKSKRKSSSYETLIKESHDLLEQLYIQVVSHRVRDVAPQTRLLTVVMISELTHCYPKYQTDDYLKYVGTALGDSESTIRLEAVRQLVQLYCFARTVRIRLREDDANDVVRDVLRRYKARILFMSRDSAPVVIMAGVTLIDEMKGLCFPVL